jgi:hypothetical protein
MPGEEWKLASYSKHRRSLTTVVVRHDNAGYNMAQVTVETNCKLKYEIFLDPAYGPDVVPSDYHIFVLSDVL